MGSLGSDARALRVALIGSGPAGFYAAGALVKSDYNVCVDIFEKLFVPYGLVRSGVAPDHPKIKNVTGQYVKIANHPSVCFWGNVDVGHDISLEELKKYYDAVVLCHGALSDRRLGIPGEDLPGSYTATEFVGWYNCHPLFNNRNFDLSGRSALIIGQGNVAIDVARVLAKSSDSLAETDIGAFALSSLEQSGLKEISVIGRRGPLQAAFTDKEIKELGEIADCCVRVDPKDLKLSSVDEREFKEADKGTLRNYSLLSEYSTNSLEKCATSSRCINIRFYLSPVEIIGKNRVDAVKFEKMVLAGEPGRQRAKGTGSYETLPCDVLFRSIGYRGVGLPGLPFDEGRGVYPNRNGRLIGEDGRTLAGWYAAGWIKRGPSGVIGTNKPDSVETVKCLLEDISTLPACEVPDSSELRSKLQEKGIRIINFEEWQKIDLAEKENGKRLGKVRDKFLDLERVLSLLG